MAEKDFVSFLVEETFKLQKSGESQLSSLDQKLSDYSLAFLKGEFIPQSQMLRFITPFGLMDIPINWSYFDLDYASQSHVLLDSHNDSEHFFQIIKQAWNQSLEMILILHADGFCYMVGLKEGEEGYLHDLIPQSPHRLLRSA